MIYSKKQDVLTYLEKLPLIEGDFSKTFTISTEVDQIVEWSPTSNEASQEGFSFGTVEVDGEELEVANFTFSNTKEAKASLIEAIEEAIESPEYADKAKVLLDNIYSGIHIISKEEGFNLPEEHSYDYHHLQIAKTVFGKELFMDFANQHIKQELKEYEKNHNEIKEEKIITDNNDFVKQKIDFEKYIKNAPINEQNILKQAFNLYETTFTTVYNLKTTSPLKSIFEPNKTYSKPLEYAYDYIKEFLNQVEGMGCGVWATGIKYDKHSECLNVPYLRSFINPITKDEENFFGKMFVVFAKINVEPMEKFDENEIELCKEAFVKLVNAEPFDDETEKAENIIKAKDSLENPYEKNIETNKENADTNAEEDYDYGDYGDYDVE
jgi:hypothetical protein